MLAKYRITLLEPHKTSLQIAFDCDAEDLEHAIEQAKSAYPDGRILSGILWSALPERHWAITGRIPGDDEDSITTTVARTREEAIAAFEADIWVMEVWRGEELMEDRRESLRKEHGACIFINTITVSSSAIEIV